MTRKKTGAKIPRKVSRAPITLATWDLGASGPANQERLADQERGAVDIETGKKINPNAIWGKIREPWVTRYAKQGKLTTAHLSAALRLYAAFAGHPARDPIAAISDRVDGGGTNDPQVAAVDRRREFRLMWAAVPQSSRPAVEHVVLNDMSIRSMAGCTNPDIAAKYFGRLALGLEAVG